MQKKMINREFYFSQILKEHSIVSNIVPFFQTLDRFNFGPNLKAWVHLIKKTQRVVFFKMVSYPSLFV